MRSRIQQLVFGFALLYSLALSFMMLSGIEHYGVLGPVTLVHVDVSPTDTAAPELYASLADVVSHSDGGILRELPNVTDPTQTRDVYVFDSAPDTAPEAWLQNGYPAFNSRVHRVIHPWDELAATDPVGEYAIFGGPAVTQSVTEIFQAAGYAVTTRDYLAAPSILGWLVNQALGWTIPIAVLLTCTATTAGTLAAARSYSIRREHGAGALDLFLGDLIRNSPGFAITMLALAIATGSVLFALNRFAHLRLFMAIFGISAAVLLLIFLISLAVTIVITGLGKDSELIKGKLPFRPAFGICYLIRIGATLLTIFLILMTATFTARASQINHDQRFWAADREIVNVNLGAQIAGPQSEQATTRLAAWIYALQIDGKAFLAFRDDASAWLPAVDVENVHLVDANFLAHQTILTDDGARLGASDVAGTTLLISAALPQSEKTQAVTSFEEALALRASRPGVTSTDFQVVEIAPDQQAFMYQSNFDGSGNSLDQLEILIVEDPRRPIIADFDRVSYLSSQAIFVDNMTLATNTAAGMGADEYIMSFRLAALESARQLARANSEAITSIINSILAVVVLFISAILIAQTYVGQYAERLLVQFLHGWPTRFQFHRLLAVEALLFLVAVGWSAISTWQAQQRTSHTAANPRAYLTESQQQPLIVMLVMLANSLILFIALRSIAGRVTRSRRAEA